MRYATWSHTDSQNLLQGSHGPRELGTELFKRVKVRPPPRLRPHNLGQLLGLCQRRSPRPCLLMKFADAEYRDVLQFTLVHGGIGRRVTIDLDGLDIDITVLCFPPKILDHPGENAPIILIADSSKVRSSELHDPRLVEGEAVELQVVPVKARRGGAEKRGSLLFSLVITFGTCYVTGGRGALYLPEEISAYRFLLHVCGTCYVTGGRSALRTAFSSMFDRSKVEADVIDGSVEMLWNALFNSGNGRGSRQLATFNFNQVSAPRT
ncbi:hypothetical protein FPV67DRAFT_1486168 [Lyophyllum atratum]|nr:hypothetical protein FPV67DRAFT_1486168 [Lyophyllum atratum]